MDTSTRKQGDSSSQSDKEEQTAVPYTPPPPPTVSSQKKFNSPAVNTAILVGIIFIGGFMTYNFIGSKLTRLSAASIEVTAIPTLSVTPSPTP